MQQSANIAEQRSGNVLSYATGKLRAIASGRGVWALGDQATLSLGNFLTNIFLGRYLLPDDFGDFFSIFQLFLFLNNLHAALVTYPLSITASTGKDGRVRSLTLGALGLTLLLGLPICLIVAAVTYKMRGIAVVPWAVIALIAWQIQETVRRALMARLQFGRAMIGDIFSYLGQAGGLFLLAHLTTLTLPLIFVVMTITSLTAALVQAAQLKLHESREETVELVPQARSHWALGQWVLMSNLISLFAVYATPWVLRYYHGAGEVAAYAAIANLLNLANPVFSSIGGLIVPAVAKAKEEHGLHAARRAAQHYGMQGAALLLPYFAFLAIAPSFALRCFYKANSPYLHMTWALRIFVAVYSIYYVAQVLGGLLNGLGKSKWSFYAQLAGALANSAICVPMGVVSGLVGVLWGGIFPMVAMLLTNLYYTVRLFSPRAKSDNSDDFVEPLTMAVETA